MIKHKKLILGILAFLIPFIILTFFFCLKHFFSDKTIIIGDAYVQYFPFFNYLKGILNGTNSIFYTFNKNLGGTMFGTFFYYLSSPMNILVKFIKTSDIPLFMTWLMIIKMSLCSLTMYLFMTYKNKTSNIVILTLSICYGLMGYNINFFVNVMWLDVVLLTPIVLIGLDKVINKQSPLLYIISLFVSIFSNYYIAYMLCIFCVIYFIYEMALKEYDKKDKLKITKNFLIISISTGLMCSFFLLPCIFESRNYLRNLDLKSILSFDYNVFDIFSKTFIGSVDFSDILNYTSMNIYCGIVVIPLVYLYLTNKNIPKKERKSTLLVIIVLILPCFIFPLSYIWHLFSKPSFYNYRYSFLICFFIINIAYKSYTNLRMTKLQIMAYLAVYSIASFYFILIICFGKYYDFLNYKMIWATLAFLFIYIGILKIKNKKVNKILLCSMLLLENIINIGIIFKPASIIESDELKIDNYEKIVEKYKDKRMDFTIPKTENDSLLMKYYGINNFISTNNNKTMRFFTQVAAKHKFINQNTYIQRDEKYILDSLIGREYILSEKELENYDLIEIIEYEKQTEREPDKIYVYKNPNSLGFGYMIDNDCNGIEYDFLYDQKIFNCATGNNENYYREYKIEKKDGEYTSIIKKKTDFYVYYPNIGKQKIVFDEKLIGYDNDYYYVKNIHDKNYELKMQISETIEDDKLKVYYFDYNKFNSVINKTEKEVLDYKIIGNKLNGSINTKGGTLMITIPYEKGFIITVDGKKVKYKEVLDTFIGIDLDEGYHEISLEYKQPFLKTGIVLSIIFILLTTFYEKKLY